MNLSSPNIDRFIHEYLIEKQDFTGYIAHLKTEIDTIVESDPNALANYFYEEGLDYFMTSKNGRAFSVYVK